MNVCCVDPQHFRRFLSGEKRTEWRERRAADPRLEAIAVGEPIRIRERGSNRCIDAKVRGIMAFELSEGELLYAIRITAPAVSSDNSRKLQGWHRRAE